MERRHKATTARERGRRTGILVKLIHIVHNMAMDGMANMADGLAIGADKVTGGAIITAAGFTSADTTRRTAT